MKSNSLLLLLICISFQLFGQRKFSASLELSAGISESTQPGFTIIDNEGVQYGRNAFLKGGYTLTKYLDITLGVGLMNIHTADLIFFGNGDVNVIHNLQSHKYMAIPAGLQYHFGSFYVNPEFGIAFSQTHYAQQSIFLIDTNSIDELGSLTQSPASFYNKITFPLFLNIGTEINVKPVKILFGIKAYYSLNKMSDILTFSRNYYGVGVMTGVKF
ncbi:MAG: hypothetical protein WBP41_21355 [Saprospiraceae bacterium]